MNFNFWDADIKVLLFNLAINILIAGIIFSFLWWFSTKLAKIVKKAMRRAKVDEGIISFTFSGCNLIFKIISILITAAFLGINISSIIATLGAALVTIGLALKDSLSNIASGAIIIINHTFKIGDYLETNNFSGTVHNIELMFTTLIGDDGSQIIIPNSKLVAAGIKNHGKTKKLFNDVEEIENL